MTPKDRLMFAPRGEQAASGYALKLRSYDEACALALQEYRRHLATYGGKGVVAQKTCAAVLDEQACIETLVPLSLVRSIGITRWGTSSFCRTRRSASIGATSTRTTLLTSR